MNIIYPKKNDSDITVQNDKIEYPCIIWICGGAWMQMNKGAHLPYLADLSRCGFTVASVEYRLGHEAPFPGAIIDIKAAIRYLRANAERYSINTEKFGICGESAGGYLAAMAALIQDNEYDSGRFLDFSSAVQAVCSWYMPCDLPKLAKETLLRPAFFNGDINDKNYIRCINPISYITSGSPPFLILHGTEDKTVSLEHSEMFYEALIKKNVDTSFYIIDGAGHADLHFFQKNLWDIIINFFKEKTK